MNIDKREKCAPIMDIGSATKNEPAAGNQTSDDSQHDQTKPYMCSHCEQEAADGVIDCATCKEWFHSMHEHLSEAEFRHLGEIDHNYVCLRKL